MTHPTSPPAARASRLTRALRAAAPPTAVTAGLITVLVGVTSSAAVVFSAARAAGADPAELTSWMLALGVGLGVTCVGLSLRHRVPVVTAWSTPGAAVLATSLAGATMAQAVGAFLLSAVLITLSGATGLFARVMDAVPASLTAALLAGVLLQFGTGLFASMHGGFAVAFPMFAAYLLARRRLPRYAVLFALAAGAVAVTATGGWHAGGLRLTAPAPVFTAPAFDWRTLLGAGLPLYVVTMTGQNLPGIAALHNAGYRPPVSPLLTWTGAVNVLLAPFGAFGLNLAAITAAICTGPDAHPDRERRFLAAVWAGVFYLGLAACAGAVGALLTAMPPALVLGIAGIGLLAPIAGSLHTALADQPMREAAVVTFAATASGVTLLGIGSAFWGLVAGVLTALVTRTGRTGSAAAQAAPGGGPEAVRPAAAAAADIAAPAAAGSAPEPAAG